MIIRVDIVLTPTDDVEDFKSDLQAMVWDYIRRFGLIQAQSVTVREVY